MSSRLDACNLSLNENAAKPQSAREPSWTEVVDGGDGHLRVGSGLYMPLELGPAVKPVLAGNDQLGFGQAKRLWRICCCEPRMGRIYASTGIDVLGAVRLKQLLGLVLKTFQAGIGREVLCHCNPLSGTPGVRTRRQKEGQYVVGTSRVGIRALSADRRRP